MDVVTITLFVLMTAAPLAIVAAVMFAVGNVRALAQHPTLAPGTSLALKVVVVVAAMLLLPPGAAIGSKMGYLQPLIVFGEIAIPVTAAFLVIDIRQLMNRRRQARSGA